MSVTSSAQFITLLEKSNLLSVEQFNAARAELTNAEDGQLFQLVETLVSRGWLTRWQGQMLLSGRHAFFLGRYKLLEHLGEGGMGSVLKAEQIPLGRVVAIKTLRKEMVNSPEMVARFRREIQAVAALSHPNIVAAYDADEVGGRHFLVMEYVEGCDLAALLKQRKRFAIGEACEYIRQAALGLEHAHKRGLVHRDFKPSNLLLDTTGRVKILDMGLARIVQTQEGEQTELTQTGQVVGTPDYISPEQARDTKSADIRSDIYSLGCTLFRLLTGRVPFSGDGAIAKITARLTNDVPKLSSVLPNVPLELEAVLLKMMQREPAQRYQTPREVVRAMAPFADVDADSPSVSEPAGGSRDIPFGEESGYVLDPELNDFLNQLATAAARDEEFDTGLQDLEKTQTGGKRRSADPHANTVDYDPAKGQASEASRRPRISRAGRKLQEEIAARKRADRRRLLIGLAVVGTVIAVIVGLVTWQKMGETTLIVEWPLDEREGATAQVDGRAVSIADQPRLYFSRAPGKRTLKLTRRGFEPIEESLEFGRGETKTFQPQWKPTAATTRQLRLSALQVRVNEFLKASRGTVSLGEQAGDEHRRSADDPIVTALRRDLILFWRLHSETRESIGAAGQMSRLPWPVDSLKRESIDVQSDLMNVPQEVVGVFGNGRCMHWAEVLTVDFSPNGKLLASGGRDQTVRLWDVETGESRGELSGHAYDVELLAYAPDGRTIAACTSNEIHLWDSETHVLQRKLSFPEKIFGMAISPDGQMLAAAGDDNRITLWNLETGVRLPSLEKREGDRITSVAFSPDSRLFAANNVDNSVTLWDLGDRTVRWRLSGKDSDSPAIAFSPDGKFLTTSNGKGGLPFRYYDVETGELDHAAEEGVAASSIVFSPDGRMLAAATQSLFVLDVTTGRQRQSPVTERDDYANCVAFSPDSKLIATGGADGGVRLWHAATGKPYSPWAGHSGAANSVAISQDGRYLASAHDDSAVRVWDLGTGQQVQTLNGHRDKVESVAFSPDGTLLASGSDDGTVKVWDRASREESRTYVSDAAGSVAFSPDGRMLASTADGHLEIWDLNTGLRRTSKYEDDLRATRRAGFSPDGQMVFAAGNGHDFGIARFWDTKTLSVTGTWPDKQVPYIHDAVLSPDGTKLAFGVSENQIYLWDLKQRKEVWELTFVPSVKGVASCVFSLDGRQLAFARYDGKVDVLDPDKKYFSPLRSFQIGPPSQGPPNQSRSVKQVVLTPDGRHLVTANGNGTVYVLRMKEW